MAASAWDWGAYVGMWALCLLLITTGESVLPYTISLTFIACLALSLLKN
jgi:hypothetical protein